jgi:hypothetical protein
VKRSDLHEMDFYRWAMVNAGLLAAGDIAGADLAHIAEEIRDMAIRERRELLSRLRVLIAHLLKWRAQPEHQSRSWRTAILNQRHEIAALLEEMPSLRNGVVEALPKLYKRATEIAAVETGLPRSSFPKECPFTGRQLLDTRFWPR